LAKKESANSVAVIGLGRFGSSVALSLARLGHEVLAIDRSSELVQTLSEHLPHIVEADSTSTSALRRIGVQDFQHAVVGIGTDVEASVLTVLALTELNVGDIWAKAISDKHGRILEKTGAHHVVYPEAKMGERVAHMVTGKMIDFIEFDDGFAIVKTCAPADAIGLTLAASGLRAKYGITVVGVKRQKQDFTYATPETMIEKGDLLIVSGPTKLVEKFAART
jgi:trk system potassium uptake protein